MLKYSWKNANECKYEQEKMQMENLTDDDLEKSLSDNDSNDECNELFIKN